MSGSTRVAAGCFLRSREFYFHKLNKRYMLCLGFFKWCAAAIPAEVVRSDSGQAHGFSHITLNPKP